MTGAKSFLTVKQVAEKYPAFGERALRYLIFNMDHNGFSSVICRVGKRVLIEELAFVAWIERGACGACGACFIGQHMYRGIAD